MKPRGHIEKFFVQDQAKTPLLIKSEVCNGHYIMAIGKGFVF